MIKKFPVRVMKVINVHVEGDCRGEFEASGAFHPTHKPQYFHQCSKCGEKKTFDEKYPHYEVEN